MLSERHKQALQAGRSRAKERSRRETLADIIRNGRDCSCGITVDTTDAELRAARGCKDPYYVCPTLDTARRRLAP